MSCMESPHVEPIPIPNSKRRSEPEEAQASGSQNSRAAPPDDKKARPFRNSPPSQDRYLAGRKISLREVSDKVMSSVRSVSGSILPLSRRLLTPPSDHVPPACQLSSRGPDSLPLPGFGPAIPIPLAVPQQDVSAFNPTHPVLVEYLAIRNGTAVRTQRRCIGGVFHLSTAPVDTRDSFVTRARALVVANGGLFDIPIGTRDEFLDLWVCWNQGCPDDRVDSKVVGDEEFRLVVELMEKRGWGDKFLLEYRTPAAPPRRNWVHRRRN